MLLALEDAVEPQPDFFTSGAGAGPLFAASGTMVDDNDVVWLIAPEARPFDLAAPQPGPGLAAGGVGEVFVVDPADPKMDGVGGEGFAGTWPNGISIVAVSATTGAEDSGAPERPKLSVKEPKSEEVDFFAAEPKLPNPFFKEFAPQPRPPPLCPNPMLVTDGVGVGPLSGSFSATLLLFFETAGVAPHWLPELRKVEKPPPESDCLS